jgi:hypothetical protein
MRWNTAYNHRERAAAAIQEAYSTARICHQDMETLTERILEIRATIAHCPTWVTAYIDGQKNLMFDQLFRYHLEFCYMDKDGTLFSTWKQSSHRNTNEFFDSGRGAELADLPGNHYWMGTEKRF